MIVVESFLKVDILSSSEKEMSVFKIELKLESHI